MQSQTTLNNAIRKRDKLLKHFAGVKPFVDGSLVTITKTCGNTNCKCTQGEKHKGLYLTYKPPRRIPGQPAKTKTIYIPVAMEKEVRLWNKECAKIREIIRQVSQIQRDIIRSYVGQYGRSRKKKKGKSK